MSNQTAHPARYQSFFTDAAEIRTLMVALLGDVHGARVLEPCAGTGAFVRPLTKDAGVIDAIEIDERNVRALKAMPTDTCHVQKGDFIDHFVSGPLISPLSVGANYDAIICNPPYGLKLTTHYRKKVKARFPGLYARESYGLFMVFSLQRLREGGRFVFVVPDTFLTNRNHRSLRRYICEYANVTHLVQFNTRRFETVSFGYGNLCIIAGNRSSSGQTGAVRRLDFRGSAAPITPRSFDNALLCSAASWRQETYHGWGPIQNDNSAVFFPEVCLLGNLAECRTGIYTGDNPRYCAYDRARPPSRRNGHPIAWDEVRPGDTLNEVERQYGLKERPLYVPLIRGGHRAPFEEPAAALDWSESAVTHYRTDKKARFQNSRFYFSQGLAVPMVTSGRLSASYMEGCVFDQGAVGIFPKDHNLIPFLLVFLNSEHATAMKRHICPGANNSANYLKRLRIPVPTDLHLAEAAEICRRWCHEKVVEKDTIREKATAFFARHLSPT